MKMQQMADLGAPKWSLTARSRLPVHTNGIISRTLSRQMLAFLCHCHGLDNQMAQKPCRCQVGKLPYLRRKGGRPHNALERRRASAIIYN